MIWAHLTSSLRSTFPTRATEWGNGTILFLWSVVLVSHTDLFVESRSFVVLASIMSQEGWAMLCGVVGGGRLAMLLVNGSWRRTPHLRAVAAFLSTFFWLQISLGFFQAGTFGTGLAVYPVLFGLDVYNAFRAARDAGTSDRMHSGTRNGHDT